MALAANRTSQGFEYLFTIGGGSSDVQYFELTPGVAFNQGDLVCITNGLLQQYATVATGVQVAGVMAESFTVLTNPSTPVAPTRGIGPTGEPLTGLLGAVYTNPLNVYRCTFSGHVDSTCTSGGTTTQLNDSGLTAASPYLVGNLVYIYAGPGAGSLRTITACASGHVTVTVPFTGAPTTASSYILLGVAAASGAVPLNRGCKISQANCSTLGISTAVTYAPMAIYGLSQIYNLMLDVVLNSIFSS